MPAEGKEKNRPQKPRRRWRRRLLGLLLLGSLFLIWANGPGLRWGLKYFISKQLAAQQLSGNFEVKGTALSGVALHKISLTGTSKIKRVDSDLLQIDWTPASLFRKELTGLTLSKLHLVIDPKAPDLPTSGDAGSSSDATENTLRDTLDLVRGFIQPASIRLTDLRVEIVDTKTITLQSLLHKPESTTYLISDLKTSDHLERLIHNPRSELTWTSDGFAIDQITLLPQLSIRDLTFRPDQSASANLFIKEQKIALSSDLKKAHSLSLQSPALSIATLMELAGVEEQASGMITALEIDTSTGLLNLQVKDLRYQEQEVASASIQASTADLLSPFDQPITLEIAIDDGLTLNGQVTLAKEIFDSSAQLTFTLKWPEIPQVSGSLAYHSQTATLNATALDGLKVQGAFRVDSQTYEASATSNLTNAALLDKHLTGPLTFTAQAKGNLKEATHQGSLNLAQLQLKQPGLPDATTQGLISWNWPQSVSVTDLKMTSPEGQVQAALAWQDDTLTILQLDLIDGADKLLTISGQLPAPLRTRSLNDLFEVTQPLNLKINSQPLSFKKLSSFAPIPPGFSGVVLANLDLTGTISNPILNGSANLDAFRIQSQPDLPPVDLELNFETNEQSLFLTATADEPRGNLLTAKGKLPFLPRAWLERKKKPDHSPVDLSLSSDLDLRRIQPFVPIIRSVDGSLKIDVKVAGTISDPDLSGQAAVDINRMRLAKSPVSDFRNSSLKASFKGKEITIAPSTITASGGNAKISGTIGIAGPEPEFDLSLTGDHFLLYRTADYSFRGNPNLKLKGPYSEATISGSLQIVESLFYKDIEILPFGIPRTTEIPSPNLPSFSRRPSPTKASQSTKGFMDWKLTLLVTTQDPILIRGNLAKGEVVTGSGGVKVTGTIRDPKTAGTLITKDLVADLPLSELKVLTGEVTLRPESLTNPKISLRGESSIGQYNVQVQLFGAVQNPKLVLTSDPPLPENEIMLLLATGSASAQLEDQQVASQKALQYLLEGLRRRNGDKDKSVFQRLLKNSDQIELSLGDTNQFSGRKYSSATLEISNQWDFTTQIDEQGQTRALVIFSVRLR